MKELRVGLVDPLASGGESTPIRAQVLRLFCRMSKSCKALCAKPYGLTASSVPVDDDFTELFLQA